MKNIFIFYSMVSESTKDKRIKLHGPFIHFKITEDLRNQYIFSMDDYIEEKKYLSKYLREKIPDKIPIFHFVEYNKAVVHVDNKDPDPYKNLDMYKNFINNKNLNDKYAHFAQHNTHIEDDIQLHHDFIKSCVLFNDFMDYVIEEIKLEKTKQNALMIAGQHFDKKFEIMIENYSVCIRKK